LVVDPAQDLDVAAAGEPPVGEVALPHLVGQVGLEPDVGGFRSLLRFDLGHASSTQGAIDRCRRHGQVVMLAEMPGDRFRPGVKPSSDQFATQLHDQLGGLAQDGSWARVRPPGTGFERRVALDPVAGDELVDP
jgi:hypothetical protein